jgi:hypothetical protein
VVPERDVDKTVLLWFRGTCSKAQNCDAEVVGVVMRAWYESAPRGSMLAPKQRSFTTQTRLADVLTAFSW